MTDRNRQRLAEVLPYVVGGGLIASVVLALLVPAVYFVWFHRPPTTDHAQWAQFGGYIGGLLGPLFGLGGLLATAAALFYTAEQFRLARRKEWVDRYEKLIERYWTGDFYDSRQRGYLYGEALFVCLVVDADARRHVPNDGPSSRFAAGLGFPVVPPGSPAATSLVLADDFSPSAAQMAFAKSFLADAVSWQSSGGTNVRRRQVDRLRAFNRVFASLVPPIDLPAFDRDKYALMIRSYSEVRNFFHVYSSATRQATADGFFRPDQDDLRPQWQWWGPAIVPFVRYVEETTVGSGWELSRWVQTVVEYDERVQTSSDPFPSADPTD